MQIIVFLIILLIPVYSIASEWPKGLVDKTYKSCIRKGGASQCECLVNRLQLKFTFEDVQQTRKSRLAMQKLQRAVESFNVKCLDSNYKIETKNLMRKQ